MPRQSTDPRISIQHQNQSPSPEFFKGEETVTARQSSFPSDGRTGITRESPAPFSQHTVQVTSGQSPTTQMDSSSKAFRLTTENCSNIHDSEFVEFFAVSGELTGLESRGFDAPELICRWKIEAPEPLYLLLKFEPLTQRCSPGVSLVVTFRVPFMIFGSKLLDCSHYKSSVIIPFYNVAYFQLADTDPDPDNFIQFRIRFTSSRERLQKKLEVKKRTPAWGYITPLGYDSKYLYAPYVDAKYTINLPYKYVLMTSFERFALEKYSKRRNRCIDSVTLYKTDNESNAMTKIWEKCGVVYVAPELFNHSIIVGFFSDWFSIDNDIGFKMRFSVHELHEAPIKVAPGQFRCDVEHYEDFREHLHCNTIPECASKEDETGDCPYSSPACGGSVAINNKCYILVRSERSLSFFEATQECMKRNSTIAMMKTKREWEAFSVFLQYADASKTYILIGMTHYETAMPQYYRKTFRWIDNTISYATEFSASFAFNTDWGHTVPRLCFAYDPKQAMVHVSKCWSLLSPFVMCETHLPDRNDHVMNVKTISFPRLKLASNSFQPSALPVTTCPSGHFTFQFLACHTQSQCGITGMASFCPFSSTVLISDRNGNDSPGAFEVIALFQCELMMINVPYTFVCDHLQDCKDGSDEEFCIHSRPCSGYLCRNGQCIAHHQLCDTIGHCADNTDETVCSDGSSVWEFPTSGVVLPPAVISFHGNGTFTQTPTPASEQCPDTHFQCPGELHYCLPVYVICNGVYDCLGHEDETHCGHAISCPGFYHCWDSSVCVHQTHVCDGWSQCPRQDDELFCDLMCPPQCHCQGLAFVCNQPFNAHGFQDLRYLDAASSLMKLEDLEYNLYIIYIRLKGCGLDTLPILYFKNLQSLYLDDNLLTDVSMDVFLPMQNLRILSLAGNPLSSLYANVSLNSVNSLHSIDLSRTNFMTFDSYVFGNTSQLRELNISFCKLRRISENGFHFVSHLHSLDIRGNSIEEYPSDAFKSLNHLKFLSSSDFRFCCGATLPEQRQDIICNAPKDEISSCQDLLRSNTYRLFLWMISSSCLMGNAVSFVFRCATTKAASNSGFYVFVANLCLADFLMGVYLQIVGIADVLYRGNYLWFRDAWRGSAACHMAGVLSLLSSELSAFMICLITLDRFIVLRFPFTTRRFRRKSAVFMCLLAWIAGIALAAIPYLPFVPPWEFYGQSGLCLPLPVTREPFPGRQYSFGVLIVLNFALFLLIAAGQSVIYLSVRSSLLVTDTTKRCQDSAVARRLLLVAASDFACWFPIGVLGLLTSARVPVPGEVSVAVVIFVLPLNSALNPFLYTLNMLMEKLRKRRELELLKILEARIHGQNGGRLLLRGGREVGTNRSWGKEER